MAASRQQHTSRFHFVTVLPATSEYFVFREKNEILKRPTKKKMRWRREVENANIDGACSDGVLLTTVAQTQ